MAGAAVSTEPQIDALSKEHNCIMEKIIEKLNSMVDNNLLLPLENLYLLKKPVHSTIIRVY